MCTFVDLWPTKPSVYAVDCKPASGGSWRHFTVAGLPCRSDSKCEKNLVTGFYSCEIDGGEIGAWDYCCRDDHPCGYSQGFDYPW